MSRSLSGFALALGVLSLFLLPSAATAETCSCFSNTIFYYETTVHGPTCSPLTAALIYDLNTTSDGDCVNRGYDRSCNDSATLDNCTLSGGQVHKHGFISYSCANCFGGPDQP
jgi:hypothetical protein